MVDYLADGFDAVARFNGGSNAGHTVVLGNAKHTFHLIPSGALKGKELLIGAGVAVDPVVLNEELSMLPPDVTGRLVVDGRATLVSPLEREFDELVEQLRGSSAIGTTKRGIGPAYAMRAFRLTPRVSDLLAGFDFSAMVAFYRRFGIDPSGILGWAEESKRILAELVGDVSAHITERVDAGGSVLFEASQGTLLDLLHGSYPFVTSSHTTSSYIPSSLGIPPAMAGESLGVMKCYTTRVGSGPFPTEVEGNLGENIRSLGNEYGATTGRPRRVGWLDLVALKYAVRLNGTKKVAISKLDVLAGVREFEVCVAYSHLGSETTDFQNSLQHMSEVRPVLESPLSLYGSTFGSELPSQARKLIDYLEMELGVKVSIVSHGEERSKTIEL